MGKPKTPPTPAGNRLLSRLPPEENRRLHARLRTVPLEHKQVLYKARSPIDYAYFPCRGVVSAFTVMEDGSAIEVASVGNEGMLGLSALLGAGTSPNDVVVQVPGEALRMSADALREEAGRDGPLRRVLALYHTAYLVQVSQAVACNRRHTVRRRCCRWLLTARDRAESDSFPLTHEYLAQMLGVRRPGVTQAAGALKGRGVIQPTRHKVRVIDPTGLERVSCECYRAARDEFDRLAPHPAHAGQLLGNGPANSF